MIKYFSSFQSTQNRILLKKKIKQWGDVLNSGGLKIRIQWIKI